MQKFLKVGMATVFFLSTLGVAVAQQSGTALIEKHINVGCPETGQYCPYMDTNDAEAKRARYTQGCRQLAIDNDLNPDDVSYVGIGGHPGCRLKVIVRVETVD